MTRATKDSVEAALGTLTCRECEILQLRYGLWDQPHLTLADVAKVFKLTRERIRQIEAKALRKLRSRARVREYGDVGVFVQQYRSRTLDY